LAHEDTNSSPFGNARIEGEFEDGVPSCSGAGPKAGCGAGAKKVSAAGSGAGQRLISPTTNVFKYL